VEIVNIYAQLILLKEKKQNIIHVLLTSCLLKGSESELGRELLKLLFRLEDRVSFWGGFIREMVDPDHYF